MRRDRVLGILMTLAVLTACAGQGQQPSGENGSTTSTSGSEAARQGEAPGVQPSARQPGQGRDVGQTDQGRDQRAEQEAQEARSETGQEQREREGLAEESARRQEQEVERERLARAQREREQAERERREALARERARKQERIAELEQQIEQNDAEVARIDEANRVLREALEAAERLNAALSEEQEKYTQVDPDTGELMEPLDPERIESLREEKARLERQARELMAETGL